jgi:Tol biopolymer transport system component
MDRSGKTLGVLGEPAEYVEPSISPDAKRVAVGIKPSNSREKIWIYDVERNTRVPIESAESEPPLYGPTWSPDGRQLAYRNLAGKTTELLVRTSDGSGEERRLGEPFGGVVGAEDRSQDGRYLSLDLTRFLGPSNWRDSVRAVRVEDVAKPVLDIDNAVGGKFSPDGHWLAYSDEATNQLYVTPFPGPGGRIAVSSAGGSDARWRGDGAGDLLSYRRLDDHFR